VNGGAVSRICGDNKDVERSADSDSGSINVSYSSNIQTLFSGPSTTSVSPAQRRCRWAELRRDDRGVKD
jgi:hypothetical protein